MRSGVAITLAVLGLGAAAAPAGAQLPVPVPIIGGVQGAPVQPYGTNDVGGFRNVLPPGAQGSDTAAQFAAFEATGAVPPHFADQQHLYDNLLYASPRLTHDQIPDFFKDATFGVKAGDTESTEVPRAGVTIVRDGSDGGVPHIYGVTDEDVEFGAGYAGAEDRLFLMDVLRHTGRAELSSFIGGSAGNREMDRVQWGLAPYTEADLQRQIDQAPVLYGAEGTEMVRRLDAYVAGINAYVQRVELNPAERPAEYTAGGTIPQPWTDTDVIAEASLIGGIFGKGGGKELASAQLLRALQQRFGDAGGRAAWTDFRSKNDPEAPTTVHGTSFAYETESAFSPAGLALPDAGSTVTDAPVAPPVQAGAAPAGGSAASIGAGLLATARSHPHMSNWELVAARYSSNGHPIGVLGPQVGYYVPQILVEEDLHGPHFDARGAAFPGVNLMVQLGHGRDYAWSATTATSDNVDTFAEVTCGDDHHYLYKGQCLAMDRLDRTNSWTPSALDQTPPGSETLTAWRTVHGIVYAYGTVGGRRVAFVTARTTYMHEADSAVGFFRLNDPTYVHDPQSFRNAVDGINFGFNWAYIDGQHIAYQQSGWYPRRAPGTSPDFPVLGTGEYDWQGFDPAAHTMTLVDKDARPHAVDPPYLVSWNNKQAPGWAAADDKFDYGPVFRSQMIEARIRDAAASGPVTLQQVVQAMEEPASQDLEGWALVPILRRVIGTPSDPRLRDALDLLGRWAAGGAHRRDLDANGVDDEESAVALMDAWYSKLAVAEFGDALGKGDSDPSGDAYARLNAIVPPASVLYAGEDPTAPDYDDGWWSFISKDLRSMFTPTAVRGRWSRGYCANGSRTACRAALLSSLRAALDVSEQQLYGRGACASTPTATCFDKIRPTEASAVTVPPSPFQNRPTFQQTVEITAGPRAAYAGPLRTAAPSTHRARRHRRARRHHRRAHRHPRFTG